MRTTLKNTVIFNSLPSLSLKDLRELGLFDSDCGYKTLPVIIKSGVHGTIALTVALSNQEGNTYVEFDYSIDGRPVSYKVKLVQVASAIGRVNYFLCQVSGERCRRLYLHNNWFVSRQAIENGYYLRDTLAKSQRPEFNMMSRMRELENTVALRARKHFKSRYAGINTKRNLRILKAQEELRKMAA